MAFALESFDEDFFTTAPLLHVIDIVVPGSPREVWAEFTRQNTLDWCRALKSVTYTSPEPHQVGTTRSVVLAPGAVKMDEFFFIWDEDDAAQTYRHAFRGVRANVPGLKHFGELAEVTPAANGSRIVWTFAIQNIGPQLPSFISGPVAKAAFATVQTDTIKHFAAR